MINHLIYYKIIEIILKSKNIIFLNKLKAKRRLNTKSINYFYYFIYINEKKCLR